MRFVSSRSSTAPQSLLRQRRILTEAGLLIRPEGVVEGFHLAEGVLLFEDPVTTPRISVLQRPAFGSIAAAHSDDILTMSEPFRLCRDLTDVHAVRDRCQARGVVLRVLSGPLFNFHDPAADDATTALIINVITGVGRFQRDLQNELTAEGIAAAEAEDRYRGRPPALAGDELETVRAAFRDQGASIAGLAREHGVSRVAVRTALTACSPTRGSRPLDPDRETSTHIGAMDGGDSAWTGSLTPLAVRLHFLARTASGAYTTRSNAAGRRTRVVNHD